MAKHSLLLISALIVNFTAYTQSNKNEWKIVPSDRSPGSGSYFGASITTSGSDQIIIGAPNEKRDSDGLDPITQAGASYVFQLQPSGLWKQTQKIVPSDRDSFDEFGQEMVSTDSLLAVGVPNYGTAGGVFIFKRNDSDEWIETQQISPNANFLKNFGSSVSIDQDVMLVGATRDSHNENEASPVINSAGAAYFFKKNGNGNWIEHQKIVASDREASSSYGASVSIRGKVAVVGAFSKDEVDFSTNNIETTVGASYIYEKSINETWVETQKITASDGRKSDSFGGTVFTDSNSIFVSASRHEYNENNQSQRDYAGAVYVFEKNSGGVWVETQKLVADYRSEDAYFGNIITMKDTLLFIGAFRNDRNSKNQFVKDGAGAVYIFDKDETGTWKQIEKLTAYDREDGDNFGKSIAVSNDFIFSGAWYEDHDSNGENEVLGGGSVYIYGCISTTNIKVVSCGDYTSPAGNIYTQAGIYYDTLTNTNLCDSIITIDLIIGETYSIDTTNIYCDSVIWEGEVIKNTGDYTKTLSTVHGCDSVVTFHVTVNRSTTEDIFAFGCESYMWNGNTFTESGSYTEAFQNVVGCDSIVTLNLTINHRVIDTTASACNEFTWRGIKYLESGNYVDTILNLEGCDTTFTILNLLITKNSFNTIDTTTCGKYISPSGKEFDVSGTYNDTITNSIGCDSIITIALIANKPSKSSLDTSVCKTFTSPSGKIWTTSNTYSDTIPNALMCDSVITILLTVDSLNLNLARRSDSLISEQTGVTYKWLDCNNNYTPIEGENLRHFIFTENGSYALELTKGACIDTTECIQVSDVSVSKHSIDNTVQLFPNPVSEILTIDFAVVTFGRIKVTTLDGAEVLVKVIQGVNQSQIDVSALKSGLYFLEISSNNKKQNLKFLKY